MKLREFLSTLKTTNVNVLVKDLQDTEICKIVASGFAALADDLEQRTVNRWTINGATSVTVILNDEIVSA